jgi:hypothetical protein
LPQWVQDNRDITMRAVLRVGFKDLALPMSRQVGDPRRVTVIDKEVACVVWASHRIACGMRIKEVAGAGKEKNSGHRGVDWSNGGPNAFAVPVRVPL